MQVRWCGFFKAAASKKASRISIGDMKAAFFVKQRFEFFAEELS
jgi:hypothetical protein